MNLTVLSLLSLPALFVLMVIGCGGGSPEADTESQPRPRLYTDRPDAQDKDIEIAAGAPGTLMGWEVTASFAEAAKAVGTFEEAGQGKHFVVLNVIVKRVGDKLDNLLGQNFFNSEFSLQTPAGQVADPSMSSKAPMLVPGDMVSGEQVEGYLTYEVPAESGMHYLLFKPLKFDADRLVWGIEIP